MSKVSGGLWLKYEKIYLPLWIWCLGSIFPIKRLWSVNTRSGITAPRHNIEQQQMIEDISRRWNVAYLLLLFYQSSSYCQSGAVVFTYPTLSLITSRWPMQEVMLSLILIFTFFAQLFTVFFFIKGSLPSQQHWHPRCGAQPVATTYTQPMPSTMVSTGGEGLLVRCAIMRDLI